MIPPPHPKPALHVSAIFRRSITEKASFSCETQRMLEIQALTLQITDKVSVFFSFGIQVPTFHADVSPIQP